MAVFFCCFFSKGFDRAPVQPSGERLDIEAALRQDGMRSTECKHPYPITAAAKESISASKEEIKLLSEKNKNHPTVFTSAVADVSIDNDSYTNNMPQNCCKN